MACEMKFTCDLCHCQIDEARHGVGVQWKFNERLRSGDRIETLGNMRDANKHLCFKCMNELCYEAARYAQHSELTFFHDAKEDAA